MDAVVFVLLIAASGFVIGALARLAVPGPDPMPSWKTILLGIAGSFIGGAVAGVLVGAEADAVLFPFALGGAIVVLMLYRRFVQKRAIFGPGGKARPRERRDSSPEL